MCSFAERSLFPFRLGFQNGRVPSVKVVPGRDRRASIRIKIDRVAREDSTSSTTEKNIKVSLGKMFLSLSINFLDLSPECRFPRVGRST